MNSIEQRIGDLEDTVGAEYTLIKSNYEYITDHKTVNHGTEHVHNDINMFIVMAYVWLGILTILNLKRKIR